MKGQHGGAAGCEHVPIRPILGKLGKLCINFHELPELDNFGRPHDAQLAPSRPALGTLGPNSPSDFRRV